MKKVGCGADGIHITVAITFVSVKAQNIYQFMDKSYLHLNQSKDRTGKNKE